MMGESIMDKQLRDIFTSKRARFLRATHPNELIENSDWHVIIDTNSLARVPALDGRVAGSFSVREWVLSLRIIVKSPSKAQSRDEIIAKIPRLSSGLQGVRLYPVHLGSNRLRMSYTSRESKNLLREREKLMKALEVSLQRRDSFEIVYGDEIAGRLVRFHRHFDGGFTALTPVGYRNFRYDRIVGAAPARGINKNIPRNHQIVVAFNRNFSRVFLDGFAQN